jgi:hypothetical protein
MSIRTGTPDLVMTFKALSLLKQMPSCLMDLWLSGKTGDGIAFAGTGLVRLAD